MRRTCRSKGRFAGIQRAYHYNTRQIAGTSSMQLLKSVARPTEHAMLLLLPLLPLLVSAHSPATGQSAPAHPISPNRIIRIFTRISRLTCTPNTIHLLISTEHMCTQYMCSFIGGTRICRQRGARYPQRLQRIRRTGTNDKNTLNLIGSAIAELLYPECSPDRRRGDRTPRAKTPAHAVECVCVCVCDFLSMLVPWCE